MSGSAVRAGRAFVEVFLKDQVTANLRGMVTRLRSMSRLVTGIGAALATSAVAVGTPIALATKTFADFDDAMRQVQAVSGSSAAEFRKLTDTAKELGRTTSFTAVQVASLMTELGRAGFDPSQINEMTGAVLNLARATATDATLASGIMAASIRQFGMDAADAGRVADGLTAAANKSFNTVEQLGEALTYAGPVAKDFGMSFEDTLAILGGLGNVGIQASSAGTALRRLLTLTGAEAKNLQDIFGVSFVDAAGNARPLVDVLSEVNDATKNLGTAARAEKFNEAFGLLGITGASAIGNAAGDIRALADEIKSAIGLAASAAEAMDAGLGGSFRKLLSAAEGVQIAIGEALGPLLTKLVDWTTNAAGAVTQFVMQNKELVVGLAGIVAAAGLAGGVLMGLGAALQVAAFAVSGLSMITGFIGTIVTGAFSPVALVVAAAVAHVTALTAIFWSLADPLTALAPLATALVAAFRDIGGAILQGDYALAFEALAGTIRAVMFSAATAVIDIFRNMLTNVVGLVSGTSEGVAGSMSIISEAATRIFSEVYDAGRIALHALSLFAADVFAQAPQIIGYAFGVAIKTVASAVATLQQWMGRVFVSFVETLFTAFAGLGPSLIRAMLTGDIAGVLTSIGPAIEKALEAQASSVDGLLAGLTGGEMPELKISPETQAAYDRMAAAAAAISAPPVSPPAGDGGDNGADEMAKREEEHAAKLREIREQHQAAMQAFNDERSGLADVEYETTMSFNEPVETPGLDQFLSDVQLTKDMFKDVMAGLNETKDPLPEMGGTFSSAAAAVMAATGGTSTEQELLNTNKEQLKKQEDIVTFTGQMAENLLNAWMAT